MKSGLLLTIVVMLSSLSPQNIQFPPSFIEILQNAFDNQLSDIQVQGEGVIIRILPDDTLGDQHQKFIIRVSPTQTILIAHNIDIAERVPYLQVDSTIEFNGEYEWSSLGGTIHWTHHDPDGYHIDGWLRYQGKLYQ